MNLAHIVYTNGTEAKVPLAERAERQGTGLFLARSALQGPCEYVDFCLDAASAREGEEGYFAANNALLRFCGHTDGEYDAGYGFLRMLGIKTAQKSLTVIITGLRSMHSLIFARKDGVYTARIRFLFEGEPAEEDMAVRLAELPNGDSGYSGMARVYRDYMLHEGRCALIRDRMNPALQYAADSPEVRVRLAWKPVPSPVEEQTLENEPPLHVAVDFARMERILDACKAAGVEKAQFCLVGWNRSGHDGRWPDAFPVEPALGGEEGLRHLIAKAEMMGYRMVCHTNATDCYHISSHWSEELPIRTRDGRLSRKDTWGGGRMYDMCPAAGGERIVTEDLRKIRELGFSGLHYIDVISSVAPRRCFSPNHPCSPGEFVRAMERIAEKCHELFGGFQSEGGHDYLARLLDMGLYIDFRMLEPEHPLVDEKVPLWQLVYHGIILSNPGPATVNYPLKDRRSRLKFIEYGGRPALYLHANFHENRHWMGSEDLTAGSDAEIARTASVIAEAGKEFRALKRLQLLTMEDHRQTEPGVFVTVYEDGTRIVCNYREEAVTAEGVTVPPYGYAVLEAGR